ncbi:MAG: phage holin, LLH family [Dongiaceae bacterium]
MNLWNKLARAFKRGAKVVVADFVAPLFRTAVSKELAVILPIAAEVTGRLAADPRLLTNDDKRAAAFKEMSRRLATQQIAIGASLINTAIELAVQRFKSRP